MPRTGRNLLPNYPHHIVQRGHNRQVVFAEPSDYQYYLETLQTWKRNLEIKVYAYCLMTNHVHLVLQPPDDVGALSSLMKRLAGRQTRYANRLEARSGTLWDGRFKSSPIQNDTYLLSCCRYVELNPVRARMIASPSQYRWSSYCSRIGQAKAPWLDDHACFIELSLSAQERISRYRRFVEQGVPVDELKFIREALQRGQLTGNKWFIDEVEQIIGRRIEHRGPGNRGKYGK